MKVVQDFDQLGHRNRGSILERSSYLRYEPVDGWILTRNIAKHAKMIANRPPFCSSLRQGAGPPLIEIRTP